MRMLVLLAVLMLGCGTEVAAEADQACRCEAACNAYRCKAFDSTCETVASAVRARCLEVCAGAD